MHNSTAQHLRDKRGSAPRGMRWISGVYIPGGERRNVTDTKIKNPKVAANVKKMHDMWYAKKFGQQPA